MHIGIIFYSFSGHTLAITHEIAEKLSAAGHQVSINQLETAAPLNLIAQTVELKSIPSIESYDVILIASPVHGGRISSPIAGFLEKVQFMPGKRILCLAAHFLPYKWGAKQMIGSLNKACEAKGARIIGAVNVPRLSLRRKNHIAKVVNLLAEL